MKEVKDGSVRTVVTSPPYWNMYYYGHKEEIGYGQKYEEYLNSLDEVWSKCYDKLTSNGTLWVNISNKITKGKFNFLASDFANHITKLGFTLQNVIIWYKPNAMPMLNKNNFTNKHEYLLFFSKSNDYKFYKDRVRITQKYINLDWGKRKEKYNSKGKDPGNVWVLSPRKGNLSKSIEHPAPFPRLIPEISILSSSDENEIILDPFLGTGTTALVGNHLKRNVIGYELNSNFKKLIAETRKLPYKELDFQKYRIDGLDV